MTRYRKDKQLYNIQLRRQERIQRYSSHKSRDCREKEAIGLICSSIFTKQCKCLWKLTMQLRKNSNDKNYRLLSRYIMTIKIQCPCASGILYIDSDACCHYIKQIYFQNRDFQANTDCSGMSDCALVFLLFFLHIRCIFMQ